MIILYLAKDDMVTLIPYSLRGKCIPSHGLGCNRFITWSLQLVEFPHNLSVLKNNLDKYQSFSSIDCNRLIKVKALDLYLNVFFLQWAVSTSSCTKQII